MLPSGTNGHCCVAGPADNAESWDQQTLPSCRIDGRPRVAGLMDVAKWYRRTLLSCRTNGHRLVGGPTKVAEPTNIAELRDQRPLPFED